MKFLTDYTAVTFTGIDKAFNVYSTFVEFTLPVVNIDVSIKFYGLIIAFGFLLAVLFGGRMAYKWKIDLNKMLDVLLYGTIGGIVGARLYYVLFEWDYYSHHLSEIPKIWNGGLAIYGGLIGAILVAYFTCRKIDLNFLKFIDPALHVPYATAQRARHLGQVPGPDDHKRDQKDQNQFGKTDVEHGRPILRDY